MTKVITDEKKIQEVLNRGVETIYPDRETLEKLLLSGKRIRLYGGFDPSASSMHIGNAILINKLSQFQDLGHEVIFLIGDFTGMIGDPTDKAATRKKLTREEVLSNAINFKKQASVFLKFDGENPALIKYNSEWSDKLTFKDLIELTSNFTVQQMLQRDMFQQRLKNEKPIHLHEFLYPLAQGYDSVAMDVDLEIGGNDQMFNMMAGRHLMSSLGMRDKSVLTLKLLADDKGKKMGKSEGNAVFLDLEAKDVYGRVMTWNDDVIPTAFELCTKISMEEVKEIQKQLKEDKINPRDLKMKLSFELVKIIHGDESAKEAENYFISTFQKKEVPDEVESLKLEIKNINIIDLLLEVGFVSSKGEARRLITQNGIKIDGVVVNKAETMVELGEKEILLQKGKRFFVKVSN